MFACNLDVGFNRHDAQIATRPIDGERVLVEDENENSVDPLVSGLALGERTCGKRQVTDLPVARLLCLPPARVREIEPRAPVRDS